VQQAIDGTDEPHGDNRFLLRAALATSYVTFPEFCGAPRGYAAGQQHFWGCSYPEVKGMREPSTICDVSRHRNLANPRVGGVGLLGAQEGDGHNGDVVDGLEGSSHRSQNDQARGLASLLGVHLAADTAQGLDG